MKKWTDEEKKQFIEDWQNIESQKLVIKYERTFQSLASMAKVLGIRKKIVRNKYKLKVLLNKSNISSYWLGFIMADGHISKKGELSIGLSEIDGDHLKKLSIYLDINITYRDKPTYCFDNHLQKPVFRITCMDRVYGVKILEQFKITDKKTYNPICLDFLKTDEEFLSFVCGLFDGDGCFATNQNKKLSVIKIGCHISWVPVYEKILEKLKILGVESSIYLDKKGFMHFSITKQREMIKFHNLVKNLNIPLMDRKWSKIDSITCNILHTQ